MKTYLFAIAAILILSQSTYSQRSKQQVLDAVSSKSNEEQIIEIDSIIKVIKSNLSSYKKIQKLKDSTGYTYVYKKNKELQLISIYSLDPSQNLSYVKGWYFLNMKLIFAEQITTERKSNSIFDTEKMYLYNENLSHWVQSGNKIDLNSTIFNKTAKEVRDYANELRIENMN